MQHTQLPVRVAKLGEETRDPFEAELPLSRRPREQRVERCPIRRVAQVDDQPIAAGLPLMWRSNVPTTRLSW